MSVPIPEEGSEQQLPVPAPPPAQQLPPAPAELPASLQPPVGRRVVLTQPLRGFVIDRQVLEDFLRRHGIPLDRIPPR